MGQTRSEVCADRVRRFGSSGSLEGLCLRIQSRGMSASTNGRTGRIDATLVQPPTWVSSKFYVWSRCDGQLQPLVGEPCALNKSFELGPHDGGMLPLVQGALSEPTIYPRDDALAADHAREGHDSLGDRLGVLHHRGRVRDDAGNEDLALRQF